jgi:hypothetical protein
LRNEANSPQELGQQEVASKNREDIHGTARGDARRNSTVAAGV